MKHIPTQQMASVQVSQVAGAVGLARKPEEQTTFAHVVGIQQVLVLHDVAANVSHRVVLGLATGLKPLPQPLNASLSHVAAQQTVDEHPLGSEQPINAGLAFFAKPPVVGHAL